MSLRSRWFYSHFIDRETEAKSNWFIQLTSIRSTALNQAWLNLLFMTRFVPKLGYTSEWGELVKIESQRWTHGICVSDKPPGAASLGPTFRNHYRTDIPPQWSRDLNLTKGSPLPNSYPLTWPNQAFIRPLSSSQASELRPQAWERAFNKMHVCHASWSCPNPCLSAPWSLALFPPQSSPSPAFPSLWKKRLFLFGFEMLVDPEIWVCTLLQQPFWIKSLLIRIQICFFVDKALSYELGLKLHRGFSTGGKNCTLFWVLLCRQQTGWEFDPLARLGYHLRLTC